MPGDLAPGGAVRISVVIPAFNEQGNIGRLIEETYAAVPEPILGEVIVVDDASDDATAAEIKALIPAHGTLRYLRHGRRAGQSASMRTAITAARFPVVATMDGDGQNDPADIAGLFEKLGEPGSEPALVGGVRASRKDTGSKRFASRFANWLRDKVLDDGCPDTGCGIKVYHRDAYLALPYFTSMHRYLPAFFLTYGHQVSFAPVNDRPRLAGHSKYTNLGRALIGIYDLVGVSWLRKRTDIPPVAEHVHGDAAKTGERHIQLVSQRG
ncbi:glycosyltransferase family 2 protein [Methyloceanibacter caenitepidi]|uniref:Dolichol-phosphate mannosyltransferase n=1 Tax=Methyloceanibacter caenitepidi TaxID=1384459 RepID=A0A0A8K813_9HYPH|nr:glycosyltransferase family 2 protein [Methyloceanibacter caenitepidi]BAQ18682.1 dolichol-phosphate mannosyltransferase [Methyloceanibacter caenitepidi]